MSMIKIKETEYSYDDSQIVNFAEGLIGLPEMRRAVLIAIDEFEPFCWLASLENENMQFIVVDPKEIYAAYEPFASEKQSGAAARTLAIVKISSDWHKTTVNLRAPIVIHPETNTGAQVILSETDYQFAEALPER